MSVPGTAEIIGALLANGISDDDVATVKTREDAERVVGYIMHPKDVGPVRQAAIEAILARANQSLGR
jgi:hypothetical protein